MAVRTAAATIASTDSAPDTRPKWNQNAADLDNQALHFANYVPSGATLTVYTYESVILDGEWSCDGNLTCDGNIIWPTWA